MNRLIFACEFNENPKIFVYDYTFKLLQTINDVCTLEVFKMVYDMVNDFLYVFCKCPEYEIRTVDIKSGKVISVEKESIKIEEDFVDFRVDPGNANIFAILKKESVDVYDWCKVGNWNEDNDSIDFKLKYEKRSFDIKSLSEEVMGGDEFSCFIWNKMNVLTVFTKDGFIAVLKGDDFEIMQINKLNQSIQRALLTRKYLILLEEQWLVNELYQAILYSR